LPLSQKEQDQIFEIYKELIGFYHNKAIKIVLAHERLSEDQKLCIPAIMELRSSFEHIMRVKALLYGYVDEDYILENSKLSLFDYCIKNIDKAHGHLYRAAYDAYDGIAFKLAKDIQNLMKDISFEAAFHIIPDFNSKINKPYRVALDLVTQGKSKKDVGSKAEEEKEFYEYETAANTLQDIKDIINENMPQMTMYVREIERNRFINKWGLAVGIIGILIGIVGILLFFFG